MKNMNEKGCGERREGGEGEGEGEGEVKVPSNSFFSRHLRQKE